MNWLAKINLKAFFSRLGTFRSALFIILMSGLLVYGGYRGGNFYHGYQQKLLQEQQERLDVLYQDNENLTNQLSALEVELEIERLANQNSQQALSKLESKFYKVKKDLAFYEKVMAPEKQAEGVIIDNLIITPTTSPHHYRFQVVLVQQNKQKRFAKGYVELTLIGSLNYKPHRLKLSKSANLTRKSLSFNFQYFQMISGEFTLPDKFIPEQVKVSAILPKNRWQKYHKLDKTYPWMMQ